MRGWNHCTSGSTRHGIAMARRSIAWQCSLERSERRREIYWQMNYSSLMTHSNLCSPVYVLFRAPYAVFLLRLVLRLLRLLRLLRNAALPTSASLLCVVLTPSRPFSHPIPFSSRNSCFAHRSSKLHLTGPPRPSERPRNASFRVHVRSSHRRRTLILAPEKRPILGSIQCRWEFLAQGRT